MEVGGFAVGVASLGIQVCKGLLIFYQDWEDCPEDVQEARRGISSLKETFTLIEKSMKSPALEQDAVQRVESCLLSCNEGVLRLQKKLSKIQVEAPQGSREKAKASGVRLLYPFRKSVVEKLKETVQDLWQHLTLAIQVLHLDLGISTQIILDEVQENIGKLMNQDEEDQLEKVLKWLSAPDPTTNHEEATRKREEGTGLWFLESKAYKDWSSGKTRRIWLHGKAGCCKTVLCSSIIENTKERVASDPGMAVAYFYFSFSDPQKQSYLNLLASVVSQLIRTPLLPALNEAKKTQDRSVKTLEAIFSRLVRQNRETIIILDALDEAPEVGDERENVISGLQRLALVSDNIHWLITSRKEWDIRNFMTDWQACSLAIDENCVNTDINLYVAHEIERHKKLRGLSPAVKAQIREAFERKADGMFRWAYCQLDEIKRLNLMRPQYITRALNAMPRTLDETYERMLMRFEEVEEIKMALQWLAFSERPISVAELQEACLITFEARPYVDYESRSAMETLTEILASLIRLDYKAYWGGMGDSGIVSLAHFSVKEYLIHDRINLGAAVQFGLQADLVHQILAQSCVAYLLEYHANSDKGENIMQDDSKRDDFMRFELEREKEAYPLLSYASKYWYIHQRYVEKHSSTINEKSLHLDLLKDDGARSTWLLIEDLNGNIRFDIRRVQPLYCASRLGLVKTVSQLLHSGVDVNEIGGFLGTALIVACFYGQAEIADILLHRNAQQQSNIIGFYGSALECSAAHGHEQTTRVLLDYGTSHPSLPENLCFLVESRNKALYEAACIGSANVAQLLIHNGADVNYQGQGQYMTALGAAARFGSHQVAEILVCGGADIEVECNSWGTALTIACYYTSLSVVKVLINAHAKVNAPGGWYGSALHAACRNGDTEMARILLDAGADLNFPSSKHGTPLHACIQSGGISCLKLLIERGADVSLLPTPVFVSSAACADLLIEYSVNNLVYKSCGRAPYHMRIFQTDGDGHRISVEQAFIKEEIITDEYGNLVGEAENWRECIPEGHLFA